MTRVFFDRKENNFDFIRLVAAIGVIYTHSFDLMEIGDEEAFRKYINYSFSFYGVRVFFIISGFLIVKSLVRSKSAIEYFSKRALRIFPGLIVVVTVTALVVGPIVTTMPILTYFSHYETYTYFSNILLYRTQGSLPGFFKVRNEMKYINGSLWTLVYEFTFYILLFALFKIKLLNIRYLMLLGTLLLVVTEWFLPKPLLLNNYYSSVNMKMGDFMEFANFFASGVLYHLFDDKVKIHRYGAFMAGGILLTANIFMPLQASKIFNYILLPYLVFYLSFLKGKLNDFGKIGDYSYGFYIYSFPVQQIILQSWAHPDPYMLFIYSVLITAPFAYLSWTFVESPMLRLKKRSILQLNLVQ